MAGTGSFSSFSSSVLDLQAAQTARLQEADALLRAEHYAGVILAGHFAVEIALKIYICTTRNHSHLPQAYQTHSLKELLWAAGLFEIAIKGKKNERRQGGEALVNIDPKAPSFQQSWGTVLGFTETKIVALRYEDPAKIAKATAEKHLNAIKLAPHGVIPWLDRQK